ncbi:MAG: hypothetical protein ACT6SC_03435 [Blastomonas fulva]
MSGATPRRRRAGKGLLGWWIAAILLAALAILLATPAFAQATGPVAAPGASEALGRALDDVAGDGKPLTLSLQILVLMGLLTILPSMLLMMTSLVEREDQHCAASLTLRA